MKVYLCKDVPQIGAAGEIIKVSDGYADNFLIPRKLAIKVTNENEAFYKNKVKVLENRKEVIATETSLLAERIKSLQLTLKRKTHDVDKLYASISAADIVEILGENGVRVSKNQVLLDKSIKQKGNYDITVKLSSRLQPTFKLKVVAE